MSTSTYDQRAHDESIQSYPMTETKSDKAMQDDLGHAEVARPVDVVDTAEDGKIVDAVWGTIEEGGPNYRSLGW
ncbi:hypothetical protein IAT40_002843 [Kwoniella sp. CBS 6097]